ncbi:MAG TPA: hypothetical protein DCY06_12285 [Bacteroidetes bacterium]|nr:hypothetical protein [Bacteroidota bacterium]
MLKTYFAGSIYVLITVLFLTSGNLYSQENIDYSKQKDLKDVTRKLFSSKKDSIDPRLKFSDKREPSFTFLPGVSYNPATAFVIGFNATKAWYLGTSKNTNNSSANLSASYTTKNQFKFSLQQNVFTNDNKINFQGDARLWLFAQNTYGLGTATKPADIQDMDFNLIRFNENILLNAAKNLFLGIGYSFEYYYKISTVDSSGMFLYPNHNNTYSKRHGLDSTKSISSGPVFNIYFDSRDNTVNAYKGFVFDFKYYFYNTFFGSQSNWQKITFDARAYKSLNEKNSNKVAVWFMGNWVLNGLPPYLSLTSTGWDKYNTSGRGFIQGRFRGRQFLYGEIENRIDLTSDGFIGLALFANATTASDPDSNLKIFDAIQPAGGVGIRIKFDKYSRTNIAVDYAVGNFGSSGIFMSIGEFF